MPQCHIAGDANRDTCALSRVILSVAVWRLMSRCYRMPFIVLRRPSKHTARLSCQFSIGLIAVHGTGEGDALLPALRGRLLCGGVDVWNAF